MYTVPIFIGSSTEGLPIARSLKKLLHRYDVDDEHRLSVRLWNHGSVFGLSESTLQSLWRALDSYVFAVLVFTPDDVGKTRGTFARLPRDNILFELGLFMARLGVRRSYMVVCGKTKIATDLKGITHARIQIPKGRHSFANLRPSDAEQAALPAAAKIREKIKQELCKGPLQSTVHYIRPSKIHRDYYDRFQVLLETKLAPLSDLTKHQGGRLSWRFYPNVSGTVVGTYRLFARVLGDAQPEDVVVFVPQGVHGKRIYPEFRRILKKYTGHRIILFDQPPPNDVLKSPSIAFVGPDNKKIGDIAAMAVCDLLGQEGVSKGRFYAVSGPGGRTRLNAFRRALKDRAEIRTVETIKFVDDVRTTNLTQAARFWRQLPTGVPIAVFAGNDECALALLEEKRDTCQRVCIVGCDAIPAMRRAVEISADRSLATIDTQLQRQAEMINDLIKQRQWGEVEWIEPELVYPSVGS